MQQPANSSAYRCWPAPPERQPHPIDAAVCCGDAAHAADRSWIEDRLARLRREKLDIPVIYVGAGSCGRGAGAGSVLQRIRKRAEADDYLGAAIAQTPMESRPKPENRPGSRRDRVRTGCRRGQACPRGSSSDAGPADRDC